MTVSKAQYLGVYAKSKDLTPVRLANVDRLLTAANRLQQFCMTHGIEFKMNPKTKSQIGGETNGGFRPQNCKIGSPKSAHKEALALDWYDPVGEIDSFLMTNPEAQALAKELGFYFEHPSATVGWSHWGLVPKSQMFFHP
jgi:hypothetical protein